MKQRLLVISTYHFSQHTEALIKRLLAQLESKTYPGFMVIDDWSVLQWPTAFLLYKKGGLILIKTRHLKWAKRLGLTGISGLKI